MLDYRCTAVLFPRPPDLHQYKEQLLVCGQPSAFSRPYTLRIKDQVPVPVHPLSRLSAMNKTTDSAALRGRRPCFSGTLTNFVKSIPFGDERAAGAGQPGPGSIPVEEVARAQLQIFDMTSGTLPRAPMGRYIKIPPKKLEQKIFSKGRHGSTDPPKIEDPCNYPATECST
ncbi:unnamed protein product [Danaus chrysippus]|uniref:(African queen) hypothetical protein n=1 Tax=Danaus chrysippus TaxID=151541 RepID=A0A8J2QMD7_9NEOP|nr:unnamed protein product [Danaus chrysippus]